VVHGDDSTRCTTKEPSQPMRMRCGGQRLAGVGLLQAQHSGDWGVVSHEWEWSAGTGEVGFSGWEWTFIHST
jgi:hypothetical protein